MQQQQERVSLAALAGRRDHGNKQPFIFESIMRLLCFLLCFFFCCSLMFTLWPLSFSHTIEVLHVVHTTTEQDIHTHKLVLSELGGPIAEIKMNLLFPFCYFLSSSFFFCHCCCACVYVVLCTQHIRLLHAIGHPETKGNQSEKGSCAEQANDSLHSKLAVLCNMYKLCMTFDFYLFSLLF